MRHIKISNIDFTIPKLGEPTFDSPLSDTVFEPASSKIVYSVNPDIILNEYEKSGKISAMEKACPKNRIFHNPSKTNAGILTAGGLCPGLNDVIKGLVNSLSQDYGIPVIYGIRYGYRGLVPEYGHTPVILTPDIVDEIHTQGGTILGSARGPQDVEIMVNTLVEMKINMLFCIGGDGTLRCAHLIAEEIKRKKLPISVIGVPKTIDNDISFIYRTFGFETAVYATDPVITAAHNEAKGVYNGVGLVQLMGRDSGFIATYAALANSNANYCLIPEVPFVLDGPGGLLPHLCRRLREKQHAVIIVAEGAGQHLFKDKKSGQDASGNIKKENIGIFLKDKIISYAHNNNVELSVKYFDPSYLIRSLDAKGTDAVFCILLAQNAAHAAMWGCTDMVVGHWNGEFTHVPIPLAISQRKKVNPQGPLWQSLLKMTRQPVFNTN